jgi:exodeoxyribonuclease-3
MAQVSHDDSGLLRCGGLRTDDRVRIISFNANGLRSAANKGFFDWFRAQDADLLCVQETKAQEHQLAGPAGLDGKFLPDGYRAFFRDAITR